MRDSDESIRLLVEIRDEIRATREFQIGTFEDAMRDYQVAGKKAAYVSQFALDSTIAIVIVIAAVSVVLLIRSR